MRETFDKLLVDLVRIDAANITLTKRLESIIHFAGFPDAARLSLLMRNILNDTKNNNHRSPSAAGYFS